MAYNKKYQIEKNAYCIQKDNRVTITLNLLRLAINGDFLVTGQHCSSDPCGNCFHCEIIENLVNEVC